MADISIGDVTARLTLNATDFQRGLQDAIRTLQQFAQTKDQIIQNMQRLQSQGQAVGQAFQQTTQQFNQVNQTLNQTNQTFNQFTQNITNVTNNMRQATQGAQSFGDTWRQILQIAGGIGLATTIEGIARALVDFATSSLQVAGRMQDLQRTLTALEGTGRQAQQTIAALFETAQRAGVGFGGLTEAFTRLEAGARGTTLQHGELLQAMNNIAEGGRVMGLSTQQVSSALVAFEQILTKGKLSAEELVRQLGNAVPGGLEKTARGLGITTAELRSMAEAGVIPGTVAFQAFANEMGRIASGAGPIEGITASLARLGNEFVQWQKIIGSLLSDAIMPLVDGLTTLLATLRSLGQVQLPSWLRGLFDLKGLFVPGELNRGEANVQGVAPGDLPLAPSRFTAQIQAAASAAGVQPGLLSQLIRTESGFNPAAVSPAGALGLGQLMPGTAQQLEPGITREQLLEPDRNLRLAARYLAQQLEHFKAFDDQVKLALAAYNAGPNRIDTLLAQARQRGLPETFAGISQIPRTQGGLTQETLQYVPRVLEGVTTDVAAERQQNVNTLAEQYARQLEQANEQFDRLRARAEALATSTANYGGILNKDIAQQLQAIVDKYVQIQTYIAAFPEQAKALGADIREEVQARTREAAMLQQALLTEQGRRDLLRQQVEQLEQVEIRQRSAILQQRQGQEEAERYSRLATGALAQRRLEDQPRLAGLTLQQQIAEYEQRLVALRNQVGALGAEIEAQRVKALTPGLSAELTRVETFLGRATEDRAVQARENVLAQGDAMRKTLEEIGRVVAQHPALQALQERLQNILRTFETDLTAVAQRAYNEAKVLERAPEFQAGVARSAQYFEQQRDALRTLREENEQLLETRQQGFPVYRRTVEQEIDRRNRLQEARTGQGLFTDEEGRRNARQLLEQQRGLERAVYYADLFAQVGSSVGNAWTQALTGIADGTRTVSEAFRAMAQSILQSLIQITSQEAWRKFVELGIRLILGAATSGVGAGAGAAVGGDYSLNIAGASGGLYGGSGLQTGGIVTRPSFHMLAEGGRPEAVVPLERMREFAQSVGPSAGGQAMGGVTIMNFPNRAEADRAAQGERALGRQVIMNEIMADLNQGEGSRINRAIRSLQR